MTTLETLADYVVGFDAMSLPGGTSDAVRRAVLDLTGASLAGFDTSPVRSARKVAARVYAGGPATIWFQGDRLSPAGAAFANASAACALDLDDGHRGAGGHPGASIIPAVFAIAQAEHSDTADVLAAVAIGYEVAIRVASARDFARLDTLSTGRWCGYGAAAAASRLMGFGRAQTAHAMAIAGVAAPGLSAAGYSRQMGNSVKEGIAWATATGLMAAEIARDGCYGGPTDILDHPDYFNAATLLEGLGDDFAIQRTYHKPYACCRWIHAALDAAVVLRNQHRPSMEGINSIEVHTFSRALRLSNEVAPTTLEGAQYSLPFCLAVAVLDGEEALLPLSPDLLRRADILALATKVRMVADGTLDPLFPAQTPARLRIQSGGQAYEHEVRFARGDPDNPLDGEALMEKFTTLTTGRSDADQLASVIQRLGNGASFWELMARLGKVSPEAQD